MSRSRKSDPSPRNPHELAPEALRWRCDPAGFKFETTDELGEGPIQIIGQPRAMEALRLGLQVRSSGYNIFVAGEVGTGRSTAVRRQLATLDRGDRPPDDLLFVHRFRDPDHPRLLRCPAGRGQAFRKAMDDLVEALRKAIPELFESEEYRKHRSAEIDAANEVRKEHLKLYEKKVTEDGFALVQVQMGPVVKPDLMPVVAGNPVALAQLESRGGVGKFQRKEFDRL